MLYYTNMYPLTITTTTAYVKSLSSKCSTKQVQCAIITFLPCPTRDHSKGFERRGGLASPFTTTLGKTLGGEVLGEGCCCFLNLLVCMPPQQLHKHLHPRIITQVHLQKHKQHFFINMHLPLTVLTVYKL